MQENVQNTLILHLIVLHQNGLITADEFASASEQWKSDPSRDWEAILKDTLGENASLHGHVSEIITKQAGNHNSKEVLLQRLIENAGRSTVELLANHFSELATVGLNQSKDRKLDLYPTRVPTDTETAVGPIQPRGISRYETIGFHAKGGLGIVYIAKDLEINRTIALK